MKTKEEIQQMLDESVNTLLGQHRGRVDVVGIEQDNVSLPRIVYVKMSGGCQGCAGAKATLRTIITNHIKAFDSTVDLILDQTDHTDKANAFFKE